MGIAAVQTIVADPHQRPRKSNRLLLRACPTLGYFVWPGLELTQFAESVSDRRLEMLADRPLRQ